MNAPLSKVDLSKYTILQTLNFGENIVPFIRTYLKWQYFGSQVLYYSQLVIVFLLIYSIFGQENKCLGVMYALFGVVGSLLLIPIHEGVHALVYYMFGARDIRFGVDWKRFIFTAQAHHFVLDQLRFVWVAISPFLAISGLLFCLICFSNLPSPLFWSMLFFHTSACSGDFAFVNFCLSNKKEIITYDDCEQQVAYFLIEE